MPERAPVAKEHLDLLREYGRNPRARQLAQNPKEREHFWTAICQAAGVSYVPFAIVEAAWRGLVQGKPTGNATLVIEEAGSPTRTRVTVAWNHATLGAHTVPTRALAREVLRILSRSYEGEEAFAMDVMAIAQGIIEENEKTRKGR